MEKVKYDINIVEESIINEKSMNIRSIHELCKMLMILKLTTAPFEKLIHIIKEKKALE